MRYMTVHLQPASGEGFHPLGEQLSAVPSIQRKAIHHIELLDDGSVLLLAEGSGDRESYEAIMDSDPSVEEYMLSGDERWMAVSRFEPNEAVRWILEWQSQTDVVVEIPIHFGSGGSQRITLIGDDRSFKQLYEEAKTMSSLSLELVETGEYDPSVDRLTRSLTQRQQEILQAAVEIGYYRAPREATQADIAELVGLSSSTVGDHLRKIEHRVFESIIV